jgi:hypothetical protein
MNFDQVKTRNNIIHLHKPKGQQMAISQPKTFWGWVAAISAAGAGAIPLLPAVAISGTVSVTSGSTFEEGSTKIMDIYETFVDHVAKIGDDHSSVLTGAVISAAAGKAIGAVTNHHHNSAGS